MYASQPAPPASSDDRPTQVVPAAPRRPFPVRMVFGSMLALALAVSIASIVWEMRTVDSWSWVSLRTQQEVSPGPATGDTAAGDAMLSGDALLNAAPQKADEQVDVTPYLPSAVDGWVAQGPQPVPGTDGSVAEIVLTPREDEEFELVTPVTVYAQLSEVDKSSDPPAVKVQSIRDGKYPADASTETIAGMTATVGFSEDSRSMFVGFTQGDLAIGIDCSYRYVVPETDARKRLRTVLVPLVEEFITAAKKAG